MSNQPTAKKIIEFGPQTNGNNPVIFQWSVDSSFVAVATQNRLVYIIDKRGKKLKEIALPTKGKILSIDWDRQNEYLAILQQDHNFVYLWSPFIPSSTGNQLEQIQSDNSKAKASWMKWSYTHPILVFGTDKGNLIFYNKKNKKKIPTMGKHSKKVISGDWNNQGMLITGSEDKIITVSNYTSQTMFESFAVKSQPRNLRWTTPKTDDRQSKQRTIAAILNQKTLLLHQVGQNIKPPLELMLQPKYGKITQYSLFGDGYIVLGFTQGYYAHISTHYKQLKDEVKSERIFNAPLQAMCTNNSVYKMAVAGENKIKIISLTDWKQIKNQSIELPKNCGKINKIGWSQNGQILIISTQKGQIYGYMTSTLSHISSYNQLIALTNSFTEVTILSTSSKNRGKYICALNISTEPSSIHLGPMHLAVRVGNTLKFYQWLRERMLLQGGQQVGQRDYQFAIKKVLLNDSYVAVLSDSNKLILHPIQCLTKEKDKKFPLQNDRFVTQFALTKNFLIFLDNSSRLKFYHIQDQNVILEHKSDNQIVKIFPNKTGTKVIIQHQNGDLNLFNSATEALYSVKLVTDRVDNIVWDNQNQNQFVLVNSDKAYSYIISKNNIFGNIVHPVNQILSVQKIQNQEGDPSITRIQKGVLTLVSGILYYQTSGSIINLVGLTSHTFLDNYKFESDSQEGHLRYFFQNLSLRRFANSLIAARYLDVDNIYQALGRKALQNLQLDVALKAFQMGKNLSMVLTIQPFFHENQRNLLIGNIAMVLGKYDIAQQYYLKSSQPLNALDMRCDIQDWFVASSLAKNIAPHQQSFICKRLAIQTQSQGNNSQALKLYERSVLRGDQKMIQKSVADAHNVQCFAGIARTSIKLGDIQRGFNVARQLRDTSLLVDIAVVCQNMKQTLQAAELYQKANMFEKAAFLYLQLKMFKQAAPLMQKIKSPKLLIQFGKAKQSEGSYKQAEAAYQKAQSWEDVVRINLVNLDNLQKPKVILRSKCTTTTVASMVANYCQKRGLKKQAVQFLIMANRKQQAFVIAQTHGQMDTYADSLKQCTTQERQVIAQYYEGKSMWDKAAKQYQQAKNPIKALKLYQKAGEDHIPQMLDLVSKNKNQQNLIQQLLDYLMGQTDEQPKDPIHTYRLYRILGNYKNASKIAVTIASQQQQSGGYKNAHDILFQTVQDIKKAGAPVPLQLEKKLLILHSYILAVKRIIKLKQHQDAAFLLNRVAKNLSQFPTHAVNILTAAVVESMKADLKGLAYTWAVVVVRAQYRSQIPQNVKSKIENLARRPIKQQNLQPKTPCPFCKQPVPEFQTDCPKCLNNIPFCIASGKHILAEELAVCTLCNFTTNINYMKKMLESKDVEKTCPMCNAQITINQIKFIGQNGVSALKAIITTKEQKQDTKKTQKTER